MTAEKKPGNPTPAIDDEFHDEWTVIGAFDAKNGEHQETILGAQIDPLIYLKNHDLMFVAIFDRLNERLELHAEGVQGTQQEALQSTVEGYVKVLGLVAVRKTLYQVQMNADIIVSTIFRQTKEEDAIPLLDVTDEAKRILDQL